MNRCPRTNESGGPHFAENKKLMSGKKKKNYWCLQGDQSPQQYIRVTGSPKVGQNPGKLFISVKKEIIWRDVGNRVTIYDSAIFLYKVFQ